MKRASLAQQGIWFTERASEVGSAYHLALTVEFGPLLDVDRLELAVAAVVERHRALRTAFRDEDGVPVMVRAASVPALQRGGDLDELIRRPFNLERGPLVRFALTGWTTLVVVAHHLIFDGTSKDVLLADLAAAYDGELKPLAELPDGLEEEHEARVASVLPRAREFWRERWHEPASPLLPVLGQTGLSGEGGGGELRFGLPSGLGKGADELGVTRFEFLLAAVHALLWRYGNADPTVAVDLSTRPPEANDHIGLWVNELPVRMAPEAGRTWGDFARSVRAELRAIYQFRDVPLGRVISGLKPRVALSPVSVSYRGRSAEVAFDGQAATVDWLVFPRTARNALHLQFVDGPDGLRASVQHDKGPLEAGRVAGHLVTLLESALADPEKPVADLGLLTSPEREALRAFNDTAREIPDANVVELFEERVFEAPNAVAVVDGETEMTYAGLNDWADRIAGGLRKRGIGAGSLVAVQLERGPGQIAALLGILKAGAAYLPLDPAYPEQRRRYIVDDARVSLVLSDLAGIDDRPGPSHAGELAYVIYTSGSTGQPKGVEISHRSLLNLLLAMGETMGAASDDRWLSLASLSFDISALEIFLPLITGACVVVTDEKVVREGNSLARLIEDAGVTHVQATPSSWRMLVEAGFEGPGIVALCGGEPMDPALAKALRGRVSRLFNVYGPTETTIWSTASEIEPRSSRVTIGLPLGNTTVHVTDERLRDVPPGIVGELCIGGAGLARGYRGLPRQTAERFVTRAGERVYRTGDLVRLLADGGLEFHGRVDNQIKLRGYRIELGEIEEALLAHPGVRQAAAALHEDRLIAYAAGEVTVAALRAHLAERLPSYMLPAGYLTLDALPLTPNGKLDRAALPEPPAPQHPAEPSADASLTAVVTGIWCEVLRVKEIEPDDSLFDLGGHSLTITQITARIRKNLGVEVPFDAFFDTPTVEGIVATIVSLKGADS
ncbi:MAG TPA: amino acid adenylation domain-containing protein [Candidatus Limnocylindrales bacterium]|nr:amino acid adenylation domain-containing protein [Candidatus Limnocylindrales bacterium]